MGASLQSVLGHGAAFARIAQFHPDLTAFRRDLHAHPELGFEEVYTSGRVVEGLKVCGVDSIHTGLGKTGVVALVHALWPEAVASEHVGWFGFAGAGLVVVGSALSSLLGQKPEEKS